MTSHGRKYGEKDSHPIPVWNGIFDHCDRLGFSPLALFIWLVDRITIEDNGTGKVLGGKPVKVADVLSTIRDATARSVRRHMDTLEEYDYITRRRTPYGHSIEVRNSRKWGIWASKESGQIGQSLPRESGQIGQSQAKRVAKNDPESGQIGRNKEDSTGHSIKETQHKAATSEFWRLTGVNPASLPGPFRKTCEELLPTRNGQPLSEFMGACMDACQAMGWKIPRLFAQAKARITERGRQAPAPKFLPSMPFKERDWTMEELCPKS